LLKLKVGVVGDFFLDRYLDIDGTQTEPSLETGLDAYQVAAVRASPGAAGTVVNNLVAFGVGEIFPITMIGDDGEGFELLQHLRRQPAIRDDAIIVSPERRTPTYTKPMLNMPGQAARELNRLDIVNQAALPTDVEATLTRATRELLPALDALIVVDQVKTPEFGVVTTGMREVLAALGREMPGRVILADSRHRIGAFRDVMLKPNEQECNRALPVEFSGDPVQQLAQQCGRTVFCTRGGKGLRIVEPGKESVDVPAIPVTGPIDIVGAGDCCNAAIACALAAGLTSPDAAAFACLAASITIQQLGTTGVATPAMLRERHARVYSE
jgi:rfaE bifunctional protein kinase chain/domain